jgi:hypothetical protein
MYISRKLLPNERNYSTVEKEALAIKWSLDKQRYYLLGREFTLVTDHAPLKWMAGAKDTNARVTRWFLALQDFRFQVAHRPGKEHANADALSRLPAYLPTPVASEPAPQTRGAPVIAAVKTVPPKVTLEWEGDELALAQREDVDVSWGLSPKHPEKANTF